MDRETFNSIFGMMPLDIQRSLRRERTMHIMNRPSPEPPPRSTRCGSCSCFDGIMCSAFGCHKTPDAEACISNYTRGQRPVGTQIPLFA